MPWNIGCGGSQPYSWGEFQETLWEPFRSFSGISSGKSQPYWGYGPLACEWIDGVWNGHVSCFRGWIMQDINGIPQRECFSIKLQAPTLSRSELGVPKTLRFWKRRNATSFIPRPTKSQRFFCDLFSDLFSDFSAISAAKACGFALRGLKSQRFNN